MSPSSTNCFRESILTVFYVLFSVLMFLGPTFSPWEFPVSPYVRWFPLNVSDELIWRGIFFSHALTFLFCATNPSHHKAYIFYWVIFGSVHGTVMLVDCLLGTGGNGNSEHLYGDVLGMYVISLVSGILGINKSWISERDDEKK